MFGWMKRRVNSFIDFTTECIYSVICGVTAGLLIGSMMIVAMAVVMAILKYGGTQ